MKRGKFWTLSAVAGVSIASGWIGVGINRLLGERDSMQSVGSGIWITSPLAAVVTVRLIRHDPIFRGWNPRLREKLHWYAFGAVLFPAVSLGALKFGESRGWVSFERFKLNHHLRSASKALGPAMVKNVFEESVWRGYFTHELLESGVSTPKTNLIVSAVWGLWHLPYYLYFLPEEEIQAVSGLSRGQFAAAAMVVIASWSGPYTDLYRATDSFWPAVVMHSTEDVFVNGLISEQSVQIAQGRRKLVDPIIGAIPLSIYVIAGVVIRKLASGQRS